MTLETLIPDAVLRDILAMLASLATSLIWLRSVGYFAQRGVIEQRLRRKIIHIGTGPLFVLCWLLYSNRPPARYRAALVPLMITVQFTLVGIGAIKDPAALQAMTRNGDRREILRGPLY
jgi:phytol kinase